jgi:hypothetical protein
MDRLDIPAGSFALGGRRVRRQRPLPFDQEQAAVEAGSSTPREPGLSGQVPSALISTEQRMAALAVGGAPAWSRRLRRIDGLTDSARAEIESTWRELARSHQGQPVRFAAEWRLRAAGYDFSRVNELIRRHNEYYPAEARLPMDVHTGDFIGPGGADYRRRQLGADWILEQFPPDLGSALRRAAS